MTENKGYDNPIIVCVIYSLRTTISYKHIYPNPYDNLISHLLAIYLDLVGIHILVNIVLLLDSRSTNVSYTNSTFVR